MKQRFASRIDAEGLLNVAITEVEDASMEAHFTEHPESQDVIGIPTYWSAKFGYWPKPDNGWTCHEVM